jgi:hypothetical protein
MRRVEIGTDPELFRRKMSYPDRFRFGVSFVRGRNHPIGRPSSRGHFMFRLLKQFIQFDSVRYVAFGQ